MEWIEKQIKIMNQGKERGKKIKSLPVVLLATAKQQTYIVELTNLVPLERKKNKNEVSSRLCLIITYIIAQETLSKFQKNKIK